MASFEFFNQISTPAVPVSLFGDAATQGANIGKQIPSVVSSVIRGVQSGIDRGQKDVLNAQQSELNRQQIEMNKPAVERAQTNADVITEAQAATAQAQTAQAQYATTVAQQAQNFGTAWSQADTKQRWDMVTGGDYASVFSANPRLYDQSVNSLRLSPDLSTAVGPYAGDWLDTIRYKKQLTADYDKNQLQYQKDFANAEAKLRGDEGVQQIAGNLGHSDVTRVPNEVRLLQQGTFEEANGKVVLDNNNQPVYSKQPQSSGKYLAVKVDPNTNQIIDGSIISRDIPHTTYNTIAGLKAASVAASTRPTQYRMQQADEAFQKKVQGMQPERVQPQESPAAAQLQVPATSFSPLEYRAIVSTLGIKEPTFKAIEPRVVELKGLSQTEVLNPVAAKLPSHIESKTRVYKDITSSIIVDEMKQGFNKYTQADVDSYNRTHAEAMAASRLPIIGSSLYSLTKVGLHTGIPEKLYSAFAVKSPEELYYVTRQPKIESQLDRLYNQFSITQKKTAEAPAIAAQQDRLSLQAYQQVGGQ